MKLLDILNTAYLLVGGLLLVYVLSRKKNQAKNNQTLTPTVKPNIISTFKMFHFGKYRDLVPYIFSQAYHETGNFRSNVFVTRNNMFGMKKPERRPFVGSKNYTGSYMQYNTVSQSIQDLLLWMDYTGFPTFVPNVTAYVSELKKRSYFTDSSSNYIAGMNEGMKLYEKII